MMMCARSMNMISNPSSDRSHAAQQVRQASYLHGRSSLLSGTSIDSSMIIHYPAADLRMVIENRVGEIHAYRAVWKHEFF